MHAQSLDEHLRTMKVLSEIENTLAGFCKEFSAQFQDNTAFWNGLSNEKKEHGALIPIISRLIKARPHEFEPWKTFAPAALPTFVSKINSNLRSLQTGGVSQADVLSMAYHMEMTVIESGYPEIVKSQDLACCSALERIAEATATHKKRLVEKMRQSRNFKRPNSSIAGFGRLACEG